MNIKQIAIQIGQALGLMILGNSILFIATALLMLIKDLDLTITLVLLLTLKFTLMGISTYVIGKGVWKLGKNKLSNK